MFQLLWVFIMIFICETRKIFAWCSSEDVLLRSVANTEIKRRKCVLIISMCGVSTFMFSSCRAGGVENSSPTSRLSASKEKS